MTRITRLGLAYYAVLTIALAFGLVIGGGTGDTIAAIAAAIFALTIFVAFAGGGLAARSSLDGRRRRDESVEEEERKRRYRE